MVLHSCMYTGTIVKASPCTELLGWLSRPDICNRLSVINLQPSDVIVAATSLAEAAAFGTRKTGTKRIRTI